MFHRWNTGARDEIDEIDEIDPDWASIVDVHHGEVELTESFWTAIFAAIARWEDAHRPPR